MSSWKKNEEGKLQSGENPLMLVVVIVLFVAGILAWLARKFLT